MRRPLLVLLTATCAAALATYAWLGVYVRYEADDFCSAGVLREDGFWRAQLFWYANWSGRWAFTLIVTALQTLGPHITMIAPAVLIAVWCFVAMRSLRTAAGIAVVYATIDGAPEFYQSTLWLTGLVTYALPCVLLTAWCAAWLKRGEWRPSPGPSLRSGPPSPRSRGEGLIDILVPLLVSGLSETSAICSIIFFALGAVFTQRRRPFLIALLSAVVSLAVVAFAPGNAVRQRVSPPHLSPIAAAAAATYVDLGGEVVRSGPQLLLVLALAALLMPRRANRRLVVFAVLLAVACPLACELVSYLAVGLKLPDRALIVTHFFTVVAAAIIGASFDRKPLFTALAALALIMPVVTVVQNIRAVPRERAIAKVLDDLDAELRGGATVVTAPQSLHGNLIISANPHSWSNWCLGKYYNLPTARSTGRLVKTPQDPLVHPAERPR